MDAYYPVISVVAPTDAMEARGSRQKFWVSFEGDENDWLLKFPRPDNGEHWAEKVAAEIGHLIGVNCAKVELARCMWQTREEQSQGDGDLNQLGTICRSFTDLQHELDPEDDLQCDFFHGCDILNIIIDSYNPSLRFKQTDHNVKNIVSAITTITDVESLNPMPRWDYMLEELASYALLDGLIGNTDRHHENWMLARIYGPGYDQWEAAPSYDHASSLGRELTDERRRYILDSGRVLNYLQRGRGGVFVRSKLKYTSPLRLAKLLCRWKPDFTQRTLHKIRNVSDDDIRTVMDKVPPEFMSDTSKDFATEVVLTSKTELLRSIR
ncbi:MAG: HipA domain-containing protein [Candidatus Poribacteria bacterium]|nr:HipA domain-containing protein [Candidatus Poribacteria bacterium]